ncbi:MAG: TonB-dependent receptor [Gammaproteobacteria bacterium]|nr:MAG: TonB-dependent receptor [Gammaproteobacteria bacterium]
MRATDASKGSAAGRERRTGRVLLVVLAFAAAPAVAAELGEIVVTAQRREQALQDVPVSISAYSAEQLELRSATSLADLAAFTPNFSFVSHDAGMNFRIRGVGHADSSLFFDPGVGIYVDGIYLPRMRGVDLDLLAIERIEVLRGPQGTLFGKNTIGGAISIITARPGDEFTGSAEVTTGSYSRLDGRLSLSGPLQPGRLAAQAGIVARSRDGYGRRLDPLTGAKTGAMGNQDSFSARGSLLWTPHDDLELLLAVDGSSAHEQGGVHHLVQAFLTPAIGALNALTNPDYGSAWLTSDEYTSYATGPNYSSADAWGIALSVRWERDGWALRSMTGYRDQRTRYGWDNDGSPITVVEQTFWEDSRQFSQEIQFSGVALADRLAWVAGAYYADEDAAMAADTLIVQPLYTAIGMDRSLQLEVWNDSTSTAVFGQGTYALSDRLSLTAGARYSRDEKEVARLRRSVNTGAITVPYLGAGDAWSAVSGRAGFEFRWSDDLMTYLSAARGYKSGGINGGSTTVSDFQPFDPEYLWTYELGLRSDWLQRRLRVNASLFRSDYQDLQFRSQRTDQNNAPLVIVANVAEAEVQGFEIELSAVLAPGFELSAGAGHIDAEYTRVDPGSPITTAMSFMDTPEWSYTFAGQYTRTLAGGATVTTRLDYAWTDEQQRAVINTPLLVQEAYPTVNARLAFRSAGDRWELAVFGTNLTDERVMTQAWDLSSLAFMDAQFGPPRQWGASFRINF